ncbi:MAG: ABC transporter permease [Fuerstiella sp.]
MLSYVLNGIWHYRRINVVVLVAVAISTAVIGGSLIVGDSVRFSLRRMTQQRLGQITHVMNSPRFFRQALVAEMAAADSERSAVANTEDSTDEQIIESRLLAPAILVTGSVEAKIGDHGIRRAGSVTLLGVDESAWRLLENGGIQSPQDREVVLGFRTAQELEVDEGDKVSVWVEVPASIPRDSLLGERDDLHVEMALTVSAVIPETVGASRFDLNPGQQLPYNAFLSLATLQDRLGLQSVEAGPRNPVAKPGRVNCVLAGYPIAKLLLASATGKERTTLTLVAEGLADGMAATSDGLHEVLLQHLTPTDIGLTIRTVPDRGYLTAESERMILEDPLADAVMAAAESLGLNTAPTLVYLTNELSAADRPDTEARYSMYSIVAGLPFDSAAPLGPFYLNDGKVLTELADDEIVLSSWLANDLQVAPNDIVHAAWHEVGSHGELPEIEKSFTIKGIMAAVDPVSVDLNLTPLVEGITDVESFGDWDQPFDMDEGRITKRDHDYWTLHKATPKAFVSLRTAEALWNSRYGSYTSVRIATSVGSEKPTEEQLNSIANRLVFEIPRQLKPSELGMMFRPVRAEGLAAAVGANDFTQLFMGFSFFLILSAIILASLMFRLGIQQRVSQLGLLNAVGWTGEQIHRLFLFEGLAVCIAGAIAGAVAAVFFAQLMIYGLTTWWVGAVGTQFLLLDVQPARLVIAAGASVALAGAVIWQALRSFRDISVRDQLAGNSEAAEAGPAQESRWSTVARFVGVGSSVTAIAVPSAVVAGLVPNGEAFGGLTWQIVCFFVAGFACLTAGLSLLSSSLRRRSQKETISSLTSDLFGLALANAARSPMRSQLTTALIAFATFVIVAVGAGRRNPLSEVPDVNSGNGGFSLVAESAQPVLFSLNTDDGRKRLGVATGESALPDGVKIFPFGMKPGSDASCVNLYQTRIPTMIGASDDFIDRGGFRFADTSGENSWQLLQVAHDDTVVANSEITVPTVPVIGDMNTLMYSLKKGIGSTIMVPNESAPEYALEVVGMLDGSVFQGVLVMTDANLKRIDPDVVGAKYFLIETPGGNAMSSTSTVLESTLNDYGFDAEPVSERLAGFLAVQNTYLSTFQMLGGLGLLVGTFGLAAVMMRNVVERRREIALMRAVGFTTFRVSRLVLYENCVLLLWGILLGAASALLAMLPHLRSTGADLPWQPLLVTLGGVAVVGSMAAMFAVRTAVGVSIRDNLAAE